MNLFSLHPSSFILNDSPPASPSLLPAKAAEPSSTTRRRVTSRFALALTLLILFHCAAVHTPAPNSQWWALDRTRQCAGGRRTRFPTGSPPESYPPNSRPSQASSFPDQCDRA